MPTCTACNAPIPSGTFCDGRKAEECRNRAATRNPPGAKPATETLYCLRCGQQRKHRIDGNRRFCEVCERERGPGVAMVTPAPPVPSLPPPSSAAQATTDRVRTVAQTVLEVARADRDEYAPKMPITEPWPPAGWEELPLFDGRRRALHPTGARIWICSLGIWAWSRAGADATCRLEDAVDTAAEAARLALSPEQTPGANGVMTADHALDQAAPVRPENGGDPSGSRLRPWDQPTVYPGASTALAEENARLRARVEELEAAARGAAEDIAKQHAALMRISAAFAETVARVERERDGALAEVELLKPCVEKLATERDAARAQLRDFADLVIRIEDSRDYAGPGSSGWTMVVGHAKAARAALDGTAPPASPHPDLEAAQPVVEPVDLKRQLAAVAAEVAEWPQWKRDAAKRDFGVEPEALDLATKLIGLAAADQRQVQPTSDAVKDPPNTQGDQDP